MACLQRVTEDFPTVCALKATPKSQKFEGWKHLQAIVDQPRNKKGVLAHPDRDSLEPCHIPGAAPTPAGDCWLQRL